MHKLVYLSFDGIYRVLNFKILNFLSSVMIIKKPCTSTTRNFFQMVLKPPVFCSLTAKNISALYKLTNQAKKTFLNKCRARSACN